jgi:hypothetical protein
MNTDVCATPSIVQCAKDGDTEGVWECILNGEDVNAVNFIGQTALHKAASGRIQNVNHMVGFDKHVYMHILPNS